MDARLDPSACCWVRVLDEEGNEIFISKNMSWQEAGLLQDVLENVWKQGYSSGLEMVAETVKDSLNNISWVV